MGNLQYRLIGYPVGHSVSPQIHARLFEIEGIGAEFGLLPVEPGTLEARMPEIRALNGFNVTLPHKQAIIPFLSELHESARVYEAVNTVARRADGTMAGYNTDCDGFLHTMEQHSMPITGKVCVLGAGGAGRMFAIECVRNGADVTIALRRTSLPKAEALAEEIGQKFGKRPHTAAIDGLDTSGALIINATPVGMYPHADACPLPEEAVRKACAVFDCIYNPAETRLVKSALAAGIPAVGGLEMLVWQAVRAHEYWNGTRFTPEQVRPIVTEMADVLEKQFR